jgi:hypothetical protein
VVLAETLTPDALVDALEAGRFYSSSGVQLHSIRCTGKSLEVQVAAEEGLTYQIDFIGTNKDFPQESTSASDKPEDAEKLTRVYSSEIGQTLQTTEGTSARYDFTGKELYVRAVVTSSRKHPNPSTAGEFERAWVQPVASGK